MTNLYHQNIVPNPLCLRYNSKSETTLHALWSCPSAKQVRLLSPFSSLVWEWSIGNFAKLFRSKISILTQDELELVSLICWNIWNCHNEFWVHGFSC